MASAAVSASPSSSARCPRASAAIASSRSAWASFTAPEHTGAGLREAELAPDLRQPLEPERRLVVAQPDQPVGDESRHRGREATHRPLVEDDEGAVAVGLERD